MLLLVVGHADAILCNLQVCLLVLLVHGKVRLMLRSRGGELLDFRVAQGEGLMQRRVEMCVSGSQWLVECLGLHGVLLQVGQIMRLICMVCWLLPS